MNANGTLSLYRGSFGSGVLLGTSTFSLSTGLHYYLELRLAIHDTTGSFEIRLDGVNRLSGSNVDTKSTANANANVIAFGTAPGSSLNGHSDFYIDDLYVCDGQGTANNDFLGDCRVDSYLPTADGANSGLTPSSGATHFSLVDEAAPNDDTDYNESATLGAKDTYGFADITHNPASIFGVQVNLNVKKDDAGFQQVKDVVRSGGTTCRDCAGGQHLLRLQVGRPRSRSCDRRPLDQGRGERRGVWDGGRLMTVARLTQAAVEIASQGTPAARLTQEAVEVLSQVNPAARLSHTAVEALNQVSPAARIAQATVEVLRSTLEAPVIKSQPVIFVCT